MLQPLDGGRALCLTICLEAPDWDQTRLTRSSVWKASWGRNKPPIIDRFDLIETHWCKQIGTNRISGTCTQHANEPRTNEHLLQTNQPTAPAVPPLWRQVAAKTNKQKTSQCLRPSRARTPSRRSFFALDQPDGTLRDFCAAALNWGAAANDSAVEKVSTPSLQTLVWARRGSAASCHVATGVTAHFEILHIEEIWLV